MEINTLLKYNTIQPPRQSTFQSSWSTRYYGLSPRFAFSLLIPILTKLIIVIPSQLKATQDSKGRGDIIWGSCKAEKQRGAARADCLGVPVRLRAVRCRLVSCTTWHTVQNRLTSRFSWVSEVCGWVRTVQISSLHLVQKKSCWRAGS